MSNKSREMINTLLPNLEEIKGSVLLPANFSDASSLSSFGIEEVIFQRLQKIHEGKRTSLTAKQTREIKEDISKMLMDFYYSHFDLLNKVDTKGFNSFLQDSVILVDRHKEVIPQYSGLKARLSGMLFGFYVNYSVRQQNLLNEKFAIVAEEFLKIAEERVALNAQIMAAAAKLQALEEQKGVDA